MAFREVGGGDVHKMEAGQKLTGWLIEVLQNQGMKGNSTIITIEKEDGSKVSVWGSTVLDDKIANLSMGSFIQIEHLGKKSNKSNTSEFNDFRVFVDDENSRVIASAPSAPAPGMDNEPVMSSEPTDGGEKMPWD